MQALFNAIAPNNHNGAEQMSIIYQIGFNNENIRNILWKTGAGRWSSCISNFSFCGVGFANVQGKTSPLGKAKVTWWEKA